LTAGSSAPHPSGGPSAASVTTPQLWWKTATLRSQHAVPRATFLRSFVFAWNGLRHAVLTQRNARIHALLAAMAIVLGIWLRISPIEFAIVFVAITGVFIAEMFNTVAEACVDLITDQYHPLAQVAKDVAAGAVLLSAMLSVVIGLFVFIPHLWPLVTHWLAR
jgi:diacylglycerol kinase